MQQQQQNPKAKQPSKSPPARVGLDALKLPRLADKIYHGRCGKDGTREVLVEGTAESAKTGEAFQKPRPLSLHLEVRDHSPTGFAWGYNGSAPAQLALALLVDATGHEALALQHYQDFKRQVVAGWGDSWSITAREIRAFVAAQKKQISRHTRNWFEVDKAGLARILERKGKEFALFELIQNAWDEPGVTKVNATLEYRGRNKAFLAVEDDAPEGFQDLRHAFTLFADSAKKTNPEQRGRFNLGEKLVLAISHHVTIRTTRGGIRFDASGRHHLRAGQPVGSRVECVLKLTPDQCQAIAAQTTKLIAPERIITTFNGVPLQRRTPLAQFRLTLPTEIAADDGFLRRVNRETTLRLFSVAPGETPTLYEMGIPVVETGDKWHCDVGQKVPLTLDRENVPPGFLRQVRVAVLNQMHGQLGPEDVNSEWTEAAIGSPDCTPEAVRSYLGSRFGEKRVSFDPSDPEANKLAVSQGYTVVHGSMMSAGTWRNARKADAILPAGRLTPGPKTWTGEGNPEALPFRDWIPESQWTDGMREIAAFAQRMAEKVLSRAITVRFCATVHHLGAASYGPGGELVFNKFRLGADWFERGVNEEVVQLLTHEFGHDFCLDHLSSKYHEALCRIGARLFTLARRGDL
jgi:hypothetical protein